MSEKRDKGTPHLVLWTRTGAEVERKVATSLQERRLMSFQRDLVAMFASTLWMDMTQHKALAAKHASLGKLERVCART